jgi:hypothetical protein
LWATSPTIALSLGSWLAFGDQPHDALCARLISDRAEIARRLELLDRAA